ncbi:Bug family tripartite tricarboxylate transporter substrate binding protein [Variovorax arabinosiphilus]|uniref:Bug family tripartite tricarboxylate transporter substrate binding protein n=1 Tax=Variovorax arabinosiphilus TaxID=3053498 RepID=UPI0025777AB3|nr:MULTISPECIES: tripartite tricarboxylate transporter substrate binding protein [unclassified Variovorax]MDM0120101.1 tripartite tricarboxylate transporter substrate binding protein [Variovorax sp. J2L1-78]MDM0127986.1 tripartite tricarboxylate transporter substrate binding protein [Variovorax sp. J2L1-63]MDM0231686.1 tripartite tricarboxylate transporter substrate binding protein [Variovorax sp. J2R1-6]
MKKRFLIKAIVPVILAAVAGVVSAQAWPTKQPVRVVIPFPPGGTLDTVGRLLAQKLGEQTGQTFLVENRPGGNGTIGADNVAKAPADGYTLLFNASTFTTAPMTMKSVPYSVVANFTPVALVAKAPLSVAINKNLPITDVKSLVAYAKANPGKMTFAVGSIGSAGHLSTELLKRAGKLDYLIVPYKGTAPAFQDLIGGQIDGFIDPILGSLQYHKSGMLRVIAVTSKARAASLPDVPTVGETIDGYEFYSWYGLWGPAKLPSDITQRLNAEVNKALASADMREKLTPQGLLLTPGSVEDFVKFQRDDMAASQKIITEGNIRVE